MKIPRSLRLTTAAFLIFSGTVEAAVFVDEFADTTNLSNSANLTVTTQFDTAVVSPIDPNFGTASVEWSNGGLLFPNEPGLTLVHLFSSYTGSLGANLGDISFVAVYDDPGLTEALLGGGNLFLLVSNGNIGNYPIPVVPDATGWKLRLDFTVVPGESGNPNGSASIDSLAVVPEPGTTMMLASVAALSLLRRRTGGGGN